MATNARKVRSVYDTFSQDNLSGEGAITNIQQSSIDQELFSQIQDRSNVQIHRGTHAIYMELSDRDYKRMFGETSEAHIDTNVIYMPQVEGQKEEIPFGFIRKPKTIPHEDVHAGMFSAMGTDHLNPIRLIGNDKPIDHSHELFDYYLRQSGEEILATFISDPNSLGTSKTPLIRDIQEGKKGTPYNYYGKFLDNFASNERTALENDPDLGKYAFVHQVDQSTFILDPIVKALTTRGMTRAEIASSLAYSLAFEPINNWREITGQ